MGTQLCRDVIITVGILGSSLGKVCAFHDNGRIIIFCVSRGS